LSSFARGLENHTIRSGCCVKWTLQMVKLMNYPPR
jgi:hypothetical protein